MDRRTFLALAGALPTLGTVTLGGQAGRTEVGISGDGFLLNGTPTYPGRVYNGHRIEGLLMNVRAVQGIFDDLTPETRAQWVYPDTGEWDPDRNTTEYLAGMAEWNRHGVISFTINLQGGSPGFGGGRGGRRGDGRGAAGPAYENSAFDPDGTLRDDYMNRLARVLDHADELGMVPIVGYFYFRQDERLRNEQAVRRGVVNATNWLLDRGYRNLLIEINNECNINYEHEILQPERVTELIELVKGMTRDGRRLLVGTSFAGTGTAREGLATPATDGVVGISDFLLLHGNGPNDPELIRRMIRDTRALPTFTTKPVVINEDPNFHFDAPSNHLMVSVEEYVSWGYYEQGQSNYQDGYQSPPVNWGLNTDNKRQFAERIREITGY